MSRTRYASVAESLPADAAAAAAASSSSAVPAPCWNGTMYEDATIDVVIVVAVAARSGSLTQRGLQPMAMMATMTILTTMMASLAPLASLASLTSAIRVPRPCAYRQPSWLRRSDTTKYQQRGARGRMDGWMQGVCAGASDEANGESRLHSRSLSLSIRRSPACSVSFDGA